MDEDTVELTKENIRLTRENNRLLRKLWRVEVFGFWSKVLFVAILIGIPVLVYQYYLADVLVEVRRGYEGILEDVGKLKEIPERLSISTVIESIEDHKDSVLR
jgi:hypothetical protein